MSITRTDAVGGKKITGGRGVEPDDLVITGF